jgi:flagellar basal-body rod protein FlgC
MMSDSLEKIFTNAASGMSAQSIRMNTIASNLANAGSVGSSDEATYHAKYPIFSEVTHQIAGLNAEDQPVGGVRVTSIDHSKKPLDKRFDPNNPSADKDGFVFVTNVNTIEEMTNMIAASKDYEANVDVMNTAKNLVLQSINVLNTK